MKNKLTILILLITLASRANTYYVSAAGNDAENGMSTVTAWKTLTKVNATTFNAGDQILFNRGDTFYGKLVIGQNGSVGNPITIGSYGTGNKPVFSGNIGTATWTLVGNGVYSCPTFLNDEYSIFWEDGRAKKMATTSACLDGVWFITNPRTTLYYKPSSGVPSDHILNYVDINWTTGIFNFAIDVSNRSYISISGIRLNYHGNGIGQQGNASTSNIVIDNCDFYACHTGVYFEPNSSNNANLTVKNSYFKWCQNGIRLYAKVTTGLNTGCQIYANEMYECGTTDGTTHWTYGTDYEAIGFQNIKSSSIYSNYVHSGYQKGIIIYTLSGIISDNNLIYRNRIENNGDTSALELTGETGHDGYNNNWIYYNVFANTSILQSFSYNQGDAASQMNYFVNNTLIGSSSYLKIYTINTAQYLTIKNNIFYNSLTYKFRCDGNPTNLVMDYNLYYTTQSANFYLNGSSRNLVYMQGLGYDAHAVTTDPLFVSVSDFSLQASSPAINTGIDVGLTSDFNGMSIVGLPDIGAYELGNSVPGAYNKIRVLPNGKPIYNSRTGRFIVK